MKILRVQGDSMLPSYRNGDYVLAMRYGRRRPRAGDDIVFQHPDFGTVLKRIDRVADGRLIVRGLGVASTDPASLGTPDARDPELRRVLFRIG